MRKDKVRIIRAKVLPQALHGCESSGINETALKALRNAIAKTIVNDDSFGSSDLAYVVVSDGPDVDPAVGGCCKESGSNATGCGNT